MMSTPDSFLTASKLCDISSKVSKIKTDICDKLSIRDTSNFNKVTPKSMADCGPLKKSHIAQHLLNLISIFEPLSEYSIKLQHPGNLDINHINQVVSKCISKECNDISNSNEFNINTVRGDIKKLDGLVNELKTTISTPASLDTNLLNSCMEMFQNHQSQMDSIDKKMDTLGEKLTNSSDSCPPPPIFIDPKINLDQTAPLKSNPTEHIDEYEPKYVDDQLSQELVDFLSNRTDYTQLHGRSVLSFGEPYTYNGSPKDSNKSVPIPGVIKTLIAKITSDYPSDEINSCLINRYVGPTDFLPQHGDKEPTIKPESKIFTISIGETRDIVFRDCVSGAEECLPVAHGSLYTMSQQSQGFWKHRMDACRSAPTDSVRYSLTLRCIRSSYTNSTVIIGDSNTKHLAFGSGKGTFGNKLPGKCVEAFRIEDIKPEVCIGYQNIVVHVGVNNLKSTKRPEMFRDTRDVNVYGKFCEFRDKLDCIRSLCPKAKVIVSPILPTKIGWLNNRALEFNRYLFEYFDIVKQISSLDFNVFLDLENGLLSDEYGCFKNKDTDMIHLGRKGIRKLAVLVRDAVLTSRRNFRDYASVVRSRDVTGHTDGFVIP